MRGWELSRGQGEGAGASAPGGAQVVGVRFTGRIDRISLNLAKVVSGSAFASITWYNRSVGIQGNVRNTDQGPQWTQVEFDFLQGTTDVPPVQTRTVSGVACRSFNFTQAGPNVPGGITFVFVSVGDSFGR